MGHKRGCRALTVSSSGLPSKFLAYGKPLSGMSFVLHTLWYIPHLKNFNSKIKGGGREAQERGYGYLEPIHVQWKIS